VGGAEREREERERAALHYAAICQSTTLTWREERWLPDLGQLCGDTAGRRTLVRTHIDIPDINRLCACLAGIMRAHEMGRAAGQQAQTGGQLAHKKGIWSWHVMPERPPSSAAMEALKNSTCRTQHARLARQPGTTMAVERTLCSRRRERARCCRLVANQAGAVDAAHRHWLTNALEPE